MGRDSIKKLNVREQCRNKVSVWFGSRDNFMHPLRETVANGIDEINNNFDSGEIVVHLDKDGTIAVTDSGRGIPIAGQSDGVMNYELLFLTLFAGTNYDNAENGKISTGTNGCGMCVVNHTSSKFDVRSYRSDGLHTIRFENGGELTRPLNSKENTLDFTGTRVAFKLDERVFGKYQYNQEEVKELLRCSAGANNKVKTVFQYECEDAIEYKYETLEDFFMEDNKKNTSSVIVGNRKSYENTVALHEDVEAIEVDTLEVVMSTSAEPMQKAFLNTTYLSKGGSINVGIIVGVRDYINKYMEDNKMIDKKLGKVSSDDIENSISFVCRFESTIVEYENQTKLSTAKGLYNRVAKAYIKEVLELENIKNPKAIADIVKHIQQIQEFNNKAVARKKKLQKELSKKVDKFSNKIEGLVDCKNHGEGTELFIAEGKSALGSIVLARNAKNQAGMAIRGKITNVLKKSLSEILESQTVMDIIRALGCGIETDKKNKELGAFNIEMLRYEKIMIATDMDADGYQIQCLLLALFYKLTPELLRQGKIYIVNTPLYEVRFKDDSTVYWYSETEKDEYIKVNGESNISHISRCKGLGELDARVMAETGVNPKTRNITQVTVENVEAMIEAFRIWMEDEVSDRKEIIINNLKTNV